MRYVEPTFWASLSKEVANLDDLLTGQMNFMSGCGVVDDSEWSPSTFEDMSPRLSSRSSYQAQPGMEGAFTGTAQQPLFAYANVLIARPLSNVDFWRQLPPKSLADSFLEGYAHGYHSMVPLFHMPNFRKRYEAFWLTG